MIATFQLSYVLSAAPLGWPDLMVDALEAASLGLYWLAAYRLRRSKRRWPVARALAFTGGLTSIWLALGSGLASYDDVNGAVHMLQHLLLMMVGPPLLALGRPTVLAAQVLPRGPQQLVVRTTHHRAVSSLGHPVVAGTLYFGLMYSLTLTPLYGAAVADEALHVLSHALFLVAGWIYWQPLVDPLGRSRWSAPSRILVIMASGPLEAGLGVAVGARSTPLPETTLALTRAGGHLFLGGSMLISGLWVLLVAGQWLAAEARRTRREDIRAEALQRDGRARAVHAGLEIPTGWSVPGWILRDLESRPEEVVQPGAPG